MRSHSDHPTSKSSSILKVLRCCLDPLTHGQLGLSRPEMTYRKSVARCPPAPTQRKPRRESKAGSGIFRPAPAGDPRWTQAWNLRTHPSAPLHYRSLQSWRLVTAARGASTGPSGAAPAAPAGSGQREHTPGARLLWLAGLAPAATPDSPGPSR